MGRKREFIPSELHVLAALDNNVDTFRRVGNGHDDKPPENCAEGLFNAGQVYSPSTGTAVCEIARTGH